MPEFDPLSQRIQDGIVAERDRLRNRVRDLERDNTELLDERRRLLVGIDNLLAFNRELSDKLANLLRQAA